MHQSLVKWMHGALALSLVTGGWAAEARADESRSLNREEFHRQIEQRVAEFNEQQKAKRLTRKTERHGTTQERTDWEDWECDDAATILDPSFEDGSSMSRGSSEIYDGPTLHGVWDVYGSVELHRLGYRHQRSRNYVLDLNGSGAGGISQDFTGLIPGARYRVTFDYAVNPDAEFAAAQWNVGYESHGYVEASNPANRSWETEEGFFTAWDTTEELTIESDTGGPHGVMIDNIQIECVPPSNVSLDIPMVFRTKEDESVSWPIPVTGGTPAEFHAEGLPPGLELNPVTGMVSGMTGLGDAGTYYVDVWIDGQNGDYDYGYFVWEVFSKDGMVLHYPFNEIEEGDGWGGGDFGADGYYEYFTPDMSPYENTGIIVPEPHVVPGPTDQALRFDRGRFVATEPADNHSLRGEFSFSGWVMSSYGFDEEEHSHDQDRGYGPEVVILKGDPFYGAESGYLSYYIVQFYDELEVGFVVEDEFGYYEMVYGYTYDYPFDQWFHLAVTADDSGWKIYINGELNMEGSFGEGYRLSDMGGPLFLGNFPYLVDSYEGDYEMPLSLDDARVYDRVLSAEEIAEAGEQPPFSFTAPGDQTNEAGDEVELTLDLNGPYYWLEVEGLPESLEFDPATKTIYGEFGPCDAGVHEVWVWVVDMDENEHYGRFTWTITAPVGGLLENWSFESPPTVPANEYVRYGTGEFVGGVWKVVHGTVDLHHIGSNGIGNRHPGDGAQVLELAGSDRGTIFQGLSDLVIGNTYRLSFLYSAHPRARINTARVYLENSQDFGRFYAGRGFSPRGTPWQRFEGEFQVENDYDYIFFEGLDDGPFGMVIDQVVIECIDPGPTRDGNDLPFEPDLDRDLEITQWGLQMSRPNPFTEGTTIRFGVAERSEVEVAVYSVDGRRVRSLVDGWVDAGVATVDWNGEDDAGRPVASGTYVIRMTSPQFSDSRRVVRIR